MRCHEEAAGMVEKPDGSSPPLPPSGMKKGPWTAAEDTILVEYVRKHGEGNWNAVQKNSGLQRCGKSCRLRWANHLRPNLKKGSFTPDEELLILRLHAQLGNKWARMAAQLPGRTDNEIKNYWNTRIKRRTRAGLPLYPPDMHRQAATGHQLLLLHPHHHHQQQPLSSSPNTTPPITPTSAPASLTMYDLTTGFPAASRPVVPLLSSNPFPSKPVLELPTIKRIRSGAFQFPISGLTTLPLYHHHPPAAAAQYSLGNYDGNPVVHVESLSVKTELPSSQCQLFSVSAGCADNGNSGLLDAMLQEAQGIGGDQLKNLGHPSPSPQQHGDGDAREAEWAQLAATGSANEAHQSTGLSKPGSSHCPFGMKSKTSERAEESNNVQEISMMPAVVPDWYNGTDSGEMSNGGQSSSMTEDEIGLEMQQLASSTIAPVDRDWSIGSCSWNNMPGIC